MKLGELFLGGSEASEQREDCLLEFAASAMVKEALLDVQLD